MTSQGLEVPGNRPTRAIAYIDGFNLYYGLKEGYGDRYLWLDLLGLCQGFCRDGQTLLGVKYFTARISGPRSDHPRWLKEKLEAKRSRQTAFLDALRQVIGEKLIIHEGSYRTTLDRCRSCGAERDSHEEKMTDVNIATEMLLDAVEDEFDTAFLISGDSDLVPPIRAIKTFAPDKKVICAFPPCRVSNELRQHATSSFTIFKKPLRENQMPEKIVRTNGPTIERPDQWS